MISLFFSNLSDLENDGLTLCKAAADGRDALPAAPSPELAGKGHGNTAIADSNRLKGVRTALTMTIAFTFSICSPPSNGVCCRYGS
jgi:hypothetical protein